MRSQYRILVGLVLAFALIAAACGDDDSAETTTTGADGDTTETTAGSGGDDGQVSQRDYRFVVVSHGQSSDPFWSVAANGVSAAAADMGVEVQYQAPGTFDMVEMSQIIDAAVASNPDGLVVTIPDADALASSIEAATAAGIPVISMNSGSDVFADLGVLVHVGQTEYEAGFGGGERMAAAGVTQAICINQEVGNVALDLRCQGFADALTDNGVAVTDVLAVVQHRGFVLLAFADHHDAVHGHGAQHDAHGVDGGPVGALLVPPAHPARGGQGGRLGGGGPQPLPPPQGAVDRFGRGRPDSARRVPRRARGGMRGPAAWRAVSPVPPVRGPT